MMCPECGSRLNLVWISDVSLKCLMCGFVWDHE